MNKLQGLISRLSSPVVASRLTRQELCLSLSALHKIFSSSPYASRLRNGEEERNVLHSPILASRIKRICPQCSTQEISMLAEGWSIAFCKRGDVVDTLAVSLRQHYKDADENALCEKMSVKLGEITALLEAACSSRQYFNGTLTQLVEGILDCIDVSKENKDSAVQTRFFWAATSYLGVKKIRAIIELLQKGEKDSSAQVLVSLLANLEKESHTTLQRNVVDRQQYIQALEDTDFDQLITSKEGARYSLFQWWEKTLQPRQEVSFETLRENTARFVHHGFYDPILQAALEKAILSVLSSENDIPGLSEVVYKRPELFTQAREVLAARISRSSMHDALQSQEVVRVAFEQSLKGFAVLDEVLVKVAEELDNGTSDARAMALMVLAAADKLPDGLVSSLATQSNSVTFVGASAIIFAMQFDTSGAISSVAEQVMRGTLDTSLRGGKIEDLLLLALALSQPFSRFCTCSSGLSEAHRSLKEALLQHFTELLQDNNIPFARKISIAVRTFKLDDEKLLATLVANIAATSSHQHSSAEHIDLLEMLAQTDVINEELVDAIALDLQKVTTDTVLCCTEEQAGLKILRFAMYQSLLDAPGLSNVAAVITSTATQQKEAATPILISAGFLELRSGNDIALQQILIRLSDRSDVSMTPFLPYIVRLLYQAKRVLIPSELIESLCSAMESLLNSTSSIPSVSPSDAARLLVVYGRRQEKINPPAVLVQFASTAVLSFPPELYTSVAQVIGNFLDCDPLTTAVVQILPRFLNRLTPFQISDIIFGLGQIPHAGLLLAHQLAADVACDYVVDNSELFVSGSCIARMLHGFAQLHITKRVLYAVFSERLAKRAILATMDRVSISLSLNAFGTAKFLHKGLFDKFSRLFVDHAKGLTSADLLLSIKAMSRVMLLDYTFYGTMGDQVAGKLHELSLESQCDLLHAYGAVDLPHHQLAERVCANVASHVEELSDANKACAVLLSLSRMSYNVREDPNLGRVADFITENIDQLTVRSTSALCAVLEDANWKHTSMLKALADHTISLKKNEQLTPECSRGVLDLLAENFIHHPLARNELTPLARIVSRDVVALSEDEALEYQLLVAR